MYNKYTHIYISNVSIPTTQVATRVSAGRKARETRAFHLTISSTPCCGELLHGVTSGVSRQTCTKNRHRR